MSQLGPILCLLPALLATRSDVDLILLAIVLNADTKGEDFFGGTETGFWITPSFGEGSFCFGEARFSIAFLDFDTLKALLSNLLNVAPMLADPITSPGVVGECVVYVLVNDGKVLKVGTSSICVGFGKDDTGLNVAAAKAGL